MVVAAAAEEANFLTRSSVPRGQCRHVRGQFHFAERRWNIQLAAQSQFRRHQREQLFQRSNADRGEHRPLVLGRVENIAHRKTRGLGLKA